MNSLTVETEDSLASLLELAANNDVEGVKLSLERDPSCIDQPGLWYGRQKGSKAMVNYQRTPLMVAATYGSIDVIKVIVSLTDVNRVCGNDKTTALHCAASGGAVNVVQVVKLLLAAGADLNLLDSEGHRAVDVIVVPAKLEGVKLMLQELLSGDRSWTVGRDLRVVTKDVRSSMSFSPTGENSGLDSPFKVKSTEFKKDYPVDLSLPDIKNSIYATDEFRMYTFKIQPCSRAYSHDWTECPFVHPGENARRRDPRKFHYSCVPCPEFRKGACGRGDMCEFAHGVFECWLHPAQYRTRPCKDGINCDRRVCFFAHTPEERRQLYSSTGSAVPSPRSNSDFAAAMSLLPGSPSAASIMSPRSPSAANNGISQSNLAWQQPIVPALHLPGSNLQSSRLRSSLNARDILTEDFNMLADYDQHQLLNEFGSPLSRSGRIKSMPPTNLDDLFSAESSSSPWFTYSAVFSPTHKSDVFNQFQQQQQQQNMLSPINTSFSSDHSLFSGGGGRMSPRTVIEPISSPLSSRVSMLSQYAKLQQQQRSLSSRELRTNSSPLVGSPVNNKWGSSNSREDWGMRSEGVDEPDVSWIQSLVQESPAEGENMDYTELEAWIEQMKLDQLAAQHN